VMTIISQPAKSEARWAGETRVGIFALRDIAVGEEITYDYQFEHSGLAVAANAYRRADERRSLL